MNERKQMNAANALTRPSEKFIFDEKERPTTKAIKSFY